VDKTDLPVLGIDLGGTKISAALIKDFKVSSDVAKVSTPSGSDKIIEALIGLIDEFSKDNLLLGVGVATAGSVNNETGQVIGSTGNLPGWEGTAVKKILESKTALRTHVENDANAAAYGEYAASDRLRKKDCICTVTLGTGIGVGTVINGRLLRGSHFSSQAGHVRIAMNNRRHCTCGLWDCWEAFAAGYGLVTTGFELLENVSQEQSPLAGKRKTLTTRDIIEAAAAGDLIGSKAMEMWHEHIAIGMVSLAHAYDPDVFLIGGGLSKFVQFDLLQEMLMDRTLPLVRNNLELGPAKLGEAAGMIGVAELVRLDCRNDNQVAVG
jgi:glucokinase